MARIIACGCSITHGYFEGPDKKAAYLKSYPEVLAERYNHEIINLAKPGSSNYLIAKQIELAMSLQPDFLIVGFTSPYRFDYRETNESEPQCKRPSLSDWDYKAMSKSQHTGPGGIYNTNPVPRIQRTPHKQEFLEFILKYVDPDITADKERYTILGMLTKLKNSGIPFVGIDWMKVLDEAEIPDNVCRTHDWVEYGKKYGNDGGGHFGPDGHIVAADELVQFITQNKIFTL